MGSFSLIIVGITAVALIIGALLGLLRGLNRSILRLVLVILSLVLAFALRDSIMNVAMNMETGEGTVREMIIASLVEPESEIPEQMVELMFGLIEIIIGVGAFYSIFFMLKFVTWLILFPILKIFVKRGEKKRSLLGAVFGLVQGFVVAVMICSPLSGLMVEVNKLSAITVDGQSTVVVPAEIGITDYSNSATYKFYDGVGGWVFDTLTTVKHEDGTVIKLGDMFDGVVVAFNFADSVASVGESVSVLTDTNSAAQDKTHILKETASSLIALGDNVDSLGENSKEIVNAFVRSLSDMFAGSDEGEGAGTEVNEELIAVFEKFDLDQLDFTAIGESFMSIANYIEKTNPDVFDPQSPFTQEEANAIVNGFAQNKFILDFISKVGDSVPRLIDVEFTQEYMFVEAINNTDLSIQDKDNLRLIVGIG